MNQFQDRRSGATAAAGDDTATSRPSVGNQDAPHSSCSCDDVMLALGAYDLFCSIHGLAVTLADAVRAQKERDRG
jgi:hypothetical protein